MKDCLNLIKEMIFNIESQLNLWKFSYIYIKQEIKAIESEIKNFKDILEKYS